MGRVAPKHFVIGSYPWLTVLEQVRNRRDQYYERVRQAWEFLEGRETGSNFRREIAMRLVADEDEQNVWAGFGVTQKIFHSLFRLFRAIIPETKASRRHIMLLWQ